MFAYVACINSTCSCLYISRCSHIEAACMGFLPFVHGFLFIYMSLALTQTDPMHALLGSLFLSLYIVYIYMYIYIQLYSVYCTLYIGIYIPIYIYVYRCVYIYIYDGCCVVLQSRCDCRGDLVTQPELCCKTNGRLDSLPNAAFICCLAGGMHIPDE